MARKKQKQNREPVSVPVRYFDGADYRVTWRTGLASIIRGAAIRQRLDWYEARAVRIVNVATGAVLFSVK